MEVSPYGGFPYPVEVPPHGGHTPWRPPPCGGSPPVVEAVVFAARGPGHGAVTVLLCRAPGTPAGSHEAGEGDGRLFWYLPWQLLAQPPIFLGAPRWFPGGQQGVARPQLHQTHSFWASSSSRWHKHPSVTSRGGENAQGVNQGGWLTKTTASIEADLPFFYFFCMRLLTSALRRQCRHGALCAPSPTHPRSGTSRDHGVGWVGRDLKAHPVPTPLPPSSPGLFPFSWRGRDLGIPSGTGDFARDSASGASDLPPARSCF